MNISLPNALKTFVDEQVSSDEYSTCSEYVRELIRRDRDRRHLRTLVLDGAASPITTTADDAYFERLTHRVLASDTQ